MEKELLLNAKRVLCARPRDSLSRVLQRAVVPGEKPKTDSNSECSFEASEFKDATTVGTKAWTAVLKSQPDSGLEQRIAALEWDKELDATIWGEGCVRNVAAQALLFAVGTQPQAAVQEPAIPAGGRFQQQQAATVPGQQLIPRGFKGCICSLGRHGHRQSCSCFALWQPIRARTAHQQCAFAPAKIFVSLTAMPAGGPTS